ncbi:MAG: NAD-dependent epimerase/dehydratase family protein [Egibacteraceae bacterium]
MTTIAVVGAGTLVGRAVLSRLQREPSVQEIVAVDLGEIDMPVGTLRLGSHERLLPQAIEDAEVVVHCGLEATEPEWEGGGTTLARTVEGTRTVLEAAAKIGVRKLAVVSSAMVYGAHPDNPLPLDEQAALRADPDLPYAYRFMLAERLVEEWAGENPGVTVTVLRPALTWAAGADIGMSRHLASPRVPLVGDQSAPLQLVHADDVAEAVRLAVTRDLPGYYNVAAGGWLPVSEMLALLGRRSVTVPEATAYGAVRWLWKHRLWHLPPTALPYLMYPWVVTSERLADLGWSPEWSNRELLRMFAREHRDHLHFGRFRLRRRNLYAPAVAFGALLLGLLASQLTARVRYRAASRAGEGARR